MENKKESPKAGRQNGQEIDKGTKINVDGIGAEVNNKAKETNSLRLDLTTDIPPPPAALEVNGELWGTLGNFSTVTGPAKSRKTFTIAAATAAASNSTTTLDNITGVLPSEKGLVLYFDTEQTRYHLLKSAHRVLRMANLPKDTTKLEVYSLRVLPTEQRLEFIDEKINNCEGVGLVIIDGIRDLLRDINSPDEATKISDYLLRWTETMELHIIAVLHQNKTDTNIRGHIGTEVLNKAETVIRVVKHDKQKDVSIVSVYESRNKEFEPFAFTIDENGLPELTEIPVDEKPGRKSINPQDKNMDYHHVICTNIFKTEKEYSKGDFIDALINECSAIGDEFGDKVAGRWVQYYQSEKLISIAKKGKSKLITRQLNPN